MGYRFRGRGQFTAGSSRSGRSYTYTGRRVLLRDKNFELNWNGPVIAQQILEALLGAFTQLSNDALTYMRSIVPVDTGELRDSCYVTVTSLGSRLSIEIGATARHAVYIEFGTSSHSAQPYIRPTLDFIKANLAGLIRNEVSRRGR